MDRNNILCTYIYIRTPRLVWRQCKCEPPTYALLYILWCWAGGRIDLHQAVMTRSRLNYSAVARRTRLDFTCRRTVEFIIRHITPYHVIFVFVGFIIIIIFQNHNNHKKNAGFLCLIFAYSPFPSEHYVDMYCSKNKNYLKFISARKYSPTYS